MKGYKDFLSDYCLWCEQQKEEDNFSNIGC